MTKIVMWSGPRNISTTMMRAFENRPDCEVIDEPFYAHYLSHTGLTHPMQEEILAAQSSDWAIVRDQLLQQPAPLFFQKHMTHHITSEIELSFMKDFKHFFLIREPARMIASYANRMGEASPEAVGLPQEARIFEEIQNLTGKTPAVLDATDILKAPEESLRKLCDNLAIPFSHTMLAWPKGRRMSDGVWAPHWYKAVEDSDGFKSPPTSAVELDETLHLVVTACQPWYDQLAAHRL